MTLQASGPISASEIQTELDGTNPISLSEYYSAATGLPASGPISFSDFYGVSGLTIDLPASVTAGGTDLTSPYNAEAGITMNADGSITRFSQFGTIGTSYWADPVTSGLGADYDVQFTLTSGSAPSGLTMNVWYNMASARTISMSRISIGSDFGEGNINIRPAGGGATIDTCLWSLSVECGDL